MFVQVIQGKTKEPAKLRAAMDRWMSDLAPGARGWLGSTGGVTEDGRFIAIARFETEQAARQNSERPEQDQWWADTAENFDGDVKFSDSTQVTVDQVGDMDKAGFVQFMQGQGNDPERARELMNQDSDQWASFRPDILGSVAVEHEGGHYTMAIYFTSQAEAREGEKKDPPPELQQQMAEMEKLMVGPPDFFDVVDPWLHSPR